MDRPIVFVNSVFPCLSETFVFDQFEVLRRAGLNLVIVSNHRPAAGEVHPRMRAIQSSVHYLCDACAAEIFAAHAGALLRHPARYLRTLLSVLSAQEKVKTTLAHLTGAAIILKRFGGPRRCRLHAHFTYGAAAVAMWAARLADMRYALTLHGSDLTFDFPPDLEAKLAGADAIVSISRFNVGFLRERFPRIEPPRLEVIPFGVPPLAAPVRRQPALGTLRILTVGRLSEQKAQHHLIDACALLASRGVAYRCDIVGEGPARPLLEARIREHRLQKQVRLLGARFHDEVLALYGETDLFVLCSIAEGMPIVLMEAMRAGVPVIASAITAIPELVMDGGCLVPPGDPVALADAISAIASGQLNVEEMTARARAIIATDYDLETNHRRFKTFLDTLP